MPFPTEKDAESKILLSKVRLKDLLRRLVELTLRIDRSRGSTTLLAASALTTELLWSRVSSPSLVVSSGELHFEQPALGHR